MEGSWDIGRGYGVEYEEDSPRFGEKNVAGHSSFEDFRDRLRYSLDRPVEKRRKLELRGSELGAQNAPQLEVGGADASECSEGEHMALVLEAGIVVEDVVRLEHLRKDSFDGRVLA